MSTEYEDIEYFDDDPELSEESVGLLRRIPLKIKLASLALVSILGYSMLGSTFASNIALSTGRVEFGQGTTQALACDNNVTITPYATFANATGANAKYKLTTIKVSDVGAGCWGEDLLIRVYDSTTAMPLTLYQTGGSTNYDYIRVYDNNGVFNLQGSGLVTGDISQITNGFQVNLYNSAATPSVAQALATSVYKISIESLQHDSSLTLVSMPSGALDFSTTSKILEYASNSTFVLGTSAFTVETWAYVNSGVGNGTFYDAGGDVNSTGGFAFWIEGNQLKIRFNGTGTGDYATSFLSSWRDSWHHFAAVRGNGYFRIFVDGTLVKQDADPGSSITRDAPTVGQLSNFRTSYTIQGKIRNLRVVKGTALYSGNTLSTNYFTPPSSPLDKVTGTILLLLAQSAGDPYKDSSDNQFVTTTTGSALPGYLAP
jgi:hypothetical protein